MKFVVDLSDAFVSEMVAAGRNDCDKISAKAFQEVCDQSALNTAKRAGGVAAKRTAANIELRKAQLRVAEARVEKHEGVWGRDQTAAAHDASLCVGRGYAG